MTLGSRGSGRERFIDPNHSRQHERDNTGRTQLPRSFSLSISVPFTMGFQIVTFSLMLVGNNNNNNEGRIIAALNIILVLL